MLPVDVACHRTEGVIDAYTRGIVHPWRPEGEAALWPCLKVEEQPFFVELAVGFGLRTETGPDGDHEMGMLLMDVADHLFTVGILLCQEVHGVPEVVGAPVLPVLDDAVEGHLQRTVLIDDPEKLGGTLVTLLALPETVGPQREHRYITREMAHLGNHAVGRATVHEIVIDTVADLGGERHAFHGIVIELCAGVVVPVDAPALDGLQDILEVLEIRLFHQLMFATTVDLAVLEGAQTIDGLILVELETLGDAVGPRIRPCGARLEQTCALLAEQRLALGREGEGACLGIQAHREHVAADGMALLGNLDVVGSGDDHQTMLLVSVADG